MTDVLSEGRQKTFCASAAWLGVWTLSPAYSKKVHGVHGQALIQACLPHQENTMEIPFTVHGPCFSCEPTVTAAFSGWGKLVNQNSNEHLQNAFVHVSVLYMYFVYAYREQQYTGLKTWNSMQPSTQLYSAQLLVWICIPLNTIHILILHF